MTGKVAEYRAIVREKLRETCKLTTKARMFLDLKIEEMGLSKMLAEQCENEELEALQQEATPGQLYEMAWEYYLGDGVPPDSAKAFRLCELAVDRGHTLAAALLANFYKSAIVVKKDVHKENKLWEISLGSAGVYSEALFLIDAIFILKKRFKNTTETIIGLKKEADAGNSHAAYILGAAYYYGAGVVRDYNEAVKWYRLAADQGHADAQYDLGNCYFIGNGVARDNNEAMKWYHMAADQGITGTKKSLGSLYIHGNYEHEVNHKAEQINREIPSSPSNNKIKRYPCDTAAFNALIGEKGYGALTKWLESQQFNSQTIKTPEGKTLIQLSQQGGWRKLVGMSTALNVLLDHDGATLTVEIGAGQWVNKALVGTVSMLVLWPLCQRRYLPSLINNWSNEHEPDVGLKKIHDHV
jgi:TPR repeat protein